MYILRTYIHIDTTYKTFEEMHRKFNLEAYELIICLGPATVQSFAMHL